MLDEKVENTAAKKFFPIAPKRKSATFYLKKWHFLQHKVKKKFVYIKLCHRFLWFSVVLVKEKGEKERLNVGCIPYRWVANAALCILKYSKTNDIKQSGLQSPFRKVCNPLFC